MPRRLNIAQCITRGDTFYGAQAHYLDLCRMLAQHGHAVTAVLGSTGLLTERLEEVGVPIRVVPSLQRSIHPWKDALAIRHLRSQFRNLNTDLVATHSSKAGILGRLAAQREGIPNVFTAHGWSFEENIPYLPRQIYKQLERRVGRRTDAIIAVSELGRELAIRSRVGGAEKLHTIHYGVRDLANEAIKRSQVYKSSDHSEDEQGVRLVMVAGFRKQKDHGTLLNAVSQLLHLNWKLDLLGDGPLLEACQSQARDLGLLDRVHFRGAVTNVVDYLTEADLMVLSTHWEGLPISILEGLSVGLPAVATNVSGVREEVIDGSTGLLVEHSNVNSLQRALKRMITDVDFRNQCAVESRKLYEQKFSLETMFDKTMSLYKSIA